MDFNEHWHHWCPFYIFSALFIFSVWRWRQWSICTLRDTHWHSYHNSNTKRCYYDSWLHLSIPSYILSFSIQTSTIGNDSDTIASPSSRYNFDATACNETFSRTQPIFKRNKNESSVKARDQRIMNDVDSDVSSRISDLSFWYTQLPIFRQWPV